MAISLILPLNYNSYMKFKTLILLYLFTVLQVFGAINLTYNTENGFFSYVSAKIEGSGTREVFQATGGDVALTFYPAPGYVFPAELAYVVNGVNQTPIPLPEGEGWREHAGGYIVDFPVRDGADFSFSLTFDVTSVFVTTTAFSDGSVSPAGKTSVLNGSTVQYTATPDPGYMFAFWSFTYPLAITSSELPDSDAAGVLVDDKINRVGHSLNPNVTANPLLLEEVGIAEDIIIQAFFSPSIELDIQSTAGGTTDPAGVITLGTTSGISVSAIPSPGYLFSHWDDIPTGTLGSFVDSDTYYLAGTSSETLLANFTPAISLDLGSYIGGVVSTNGVGLSSDSSYTFPLNTPLTVKASPGYRFLNWTGDLSVLNENSASVILLYSGDYTLTPVFEVINYPVTISNTVGGSVDASSASLASGTYLAVAATADAGYGFLHWEATDADGTTLSTDPILRHTVSSAVTFNAVFAPYVTLTVTSGDGGQSDPEGTITRPRGFTQPLNSWAEIDAAFSSWTILSGTSIIADTASPTTQVTLLDDTAIHLEFAPQMSINIQTVTPSTGNGGSVSPSGLLQVPVDQIVTATPNPGYYFGYWEGDTSAIPDVTSAVTPITDPMPDITNLRAFFLPIITSYDVTVTGNGSISPKPSNNLQYGTELTLRAIPDIGWEFDSWTGPQFSGNPRLPAYPFIAVGDLQLTANFIETTATLTVDYYHDGEIVHTETLVGPNLSTQALPDVRQWSESLSYGFSSWRGPQGHEVIGANQGYATESIILDGDTHVWAIFEDYVTLTVTPSEGGLTSQSIFEPTIRVVSGTTLSLNPLPDEGYYFLNWSGLDAGAIRTINGTPTLHMSRDRFIEPNFIKYVILDLDVPNGYTNLSGLTYFKLGDVLRIEVTADIPYTFSHWSGASDSTSPILTLVMTGDQQLTAHFTRQTFDIAISKEGSGTVLPVDGGTYLLPEGTQMDLEAIPTVGYVFSHWAGEVAALMGDVTDPIQRVPVSTDSDVHAVFAPPQEFIDVTVCLEPIRLGSKWRLIGTSNGYASAQWKENCTTEPSVPWGSYNIRVTDIEDYTSPELTVTLGAANPHLITGYYTTNTDKSIVGLSHTLQLDTIAFIGYEFDQWGGSSAADLINRFSPTQRVSITGNKYFNANFAPKSYALVIQHLDAVTNLPLTAPTVEYFPSGTDVAIDTDIPEGALAPDTYSQLLKGSFFMPWGPNAHEAFRICAVCGPHIIMNSDKELYFKHTPLLFTYMEPVDGGTSRVYNHGVIAEITEPSTYLSTYGGALNISASPNTGYVFSHWEGDVDGLPSLTSSRPTIDVNYTDRTFTPVFIPGTATLTVEYEVEGKVVDVSRNTYPIRQAFSSSFLMESRAYPGYIVGGWENSAGEAIGDPNYEVPAFQLAKDTTFRVIYTEGFNLDPYGILDGVEYPLRDFGVLVSFNGNTVGVNGEGVVPFLRNELVTLSATPATEYAFVRWVGLPGSTEDPTLPAQAFTIQSDVRIGAEIKRQDFTLTVEHVHPDRGILDTDISTHAARSSINHLDVSDYLDEGMIFSHWEGDTSALTPLVSSYTWGWGRNPLNTPGEVYPTAPQQSVALNDNVYLKAVYYDVVTLSIQAEPSSQIYLEIINPLRYHVLHEICAPTAADPGFGRIPKHCVTHYGNIYLPKGTVVNLFATAWDGYTFVKWSGLDAYSINPEVPDITVTLTEPTNVVTIETRPYDVHSVSRDGLVIWLRNEDIPAVGPNMEHWLDSSGGGRHAVQRVPRLQPTVASTPNFNDLRGVQLNGVSNMTFPLITDVHTVFLVAEGLMGQSIFTYNDSNYSSLIPNSSSWAGSKSVVAGYVSQFRTTSPPFFVSGNSYGNFIQGFSFSQDFAANSLTGTVSGDPLTGSIGEVIAYDRILSASEIYQVMQYLTYKFERSFNFVLSSTFGGVVTPTSEYKISFDGFQGEVHTAHYSQVYPIQGTPLAGWDFKEWVFNSGSLATVDDISSANASIEILGHTQLEGTFHETPRTLHVEVIGAADPLIAEEIKKKIEIRFSPLLIHEYSAAAPRAGDIPPGYPYSQSNAWGSPVKIATGEQADLTARATSAYVTVDKGTLSALGYQFIRYSSSIPSTLEQWDRTPSGNVRIYLPHTAENILYIHVLTSSIPTGDATLTVTAEVGGTATPAFSTVPAGSLVSLEAIPDPGYIFSGWQGDPKALANLSYTLDPDATIVVVGDMSLTATFQPETYTVSLLHTLGGSVAPSGTNQYVSGDTIDFVVSVDPGFAFDGWTGDHLDVGIDPLQEVGTITVTQSVTMQASFRMAYDFDSTFRLIESESGFNSVTKDLTMLPWEDYFTHMALPLDSGGLLDRSDPQGIEDSQMAPYPYAYFLNPTFLNQGSREGNIIWDSTNNTLQFERHLDYNALKHASALTFTGNSEKEGTYSVASTNDSLWVIYMGDSLPAVTTSVITPEDPLTITGQDAFTVYLPTIEVNDDHLVLDNLDITVVNNTAYYINLLEYASDPIDGVADLLNQTPVAGTDLSPELPYPRDASNSANAEGLTLTGPLGNTNDILSAWDISSTDPTFNPADQDDVDALLQYFRVIDNAVVEVIIPDTYNYTITLTYYVTDNRTGGRANLGRYDPNDKRTHRPNCTPTGPLSLSVNSGWITCWGQVTVTPGIPGDKDPMTGGVQARVQAGTIFETPELSGTDPLFTNARANYLYNYHITDIFPNGETISGVSAHYILRTIACYFIPGDIQIDKYGLGCDASFSTTSSSALCDDPAIYGYQRCLDGACNYYSYVPAHITCQPVSGNLALAGTVELLPASNSMRFSNADDYAQAKTSYSIQVQSSPNEGSYGISSYDDANLTIYLAGGLTSGETSGSSTLSLSTDSSFISMVGQQVGVVAGGQTCVKLPCPLRKADCNL